MYTKSPDAEQRINRYWYTDGLGEIIGGCMFIGVGGYFALQDFLGPDSAASGVLQAGLALLLIGGALLSRRLVNALKTRLTYPRTGYVEYRANNKEAGARRMRVLILGFAVAALSAALAAIFRSVDAMVAVTGVVVGTILVLLRAKSSGLVRFYFLGGVSVVLGLALSVSGLSNGYSLGLYYGLMGVCFLISGAVALTRYLYENPRPAETQNGQ